MGDPRVLVMLDNDGRAFKTFAPLSPWAALKAGLRAASKPLSEAWLEFRYTFRKARKGGTQFHATVPLGDPILNRMDEWGEVREEQDEPAITVYKDRTGRLFTESMYQASRNLMDAEREAAIRRGQFVPIPGQVTLAFEITEERAEQLVEELEAMSLETELTENEQVILSAARERMEQRLSQGLTEGRPDVGDDAAEMDRRIVERLECKRELGEFKDHDKHLLGVIKKRLSERYAY